MARGEEASAWRLLAIVGVQVLQLPREIMLVEMAANLFESDAAA